MTVEITADGKLVKANIHGDVQKITVEEARKYAAQLRSAADEAERFKPKLTPGGLYHKGKEIYLVGEGSNYRWCIDGGWGYMGPLPDGAEEVTAWGQHLKVSKATWF